MDCPASSRNGRARGSSACAVSENRQRRIASLLVDLDKGSPEARRELFEMVYDQLRDAAHHLMSSSNGDTLQPTALLHEVMLRFLGRPKFGSFLSMAAFLRVAIDAMQGALIDHYRRKNALKRGGRFRRLALDAVLRQIECDTMVEYEVLHEALERLREHNRRQYEVVRLRFFGGLTIKQAAEVLAVSVQTVERDWRLARVRLYQDLMDEG